MMATYKELLQQREALEQQINQARRDETAQAVAQVRALIAEFGLTAQEVFPVGKASKGGRAGSGIKVAAKYRDPASGATWTGRGKAPRWIQGKERGQYSID